MTTKDLMKRLAIAAALMGMTGEFTFAQPGVVSQQGSPDQKTFEEASRIPEPGKRLAALQRFTEDFPQSPRVIPANQLVFDTRVKNYPQNTEQILTLARQVIQAAHPEFKSEVYNFVATSLMNASILLPQAEEFANAGLEELAKNNQRMHAMSMSAEEELSRRFPATAPGMRMLLGQIYLKQGRAELAQTTLQQAYKADPSLLGAAQGLADLAEKRGDNTTALELLVSITLRGRMTRDSQKQLEDVYGKLHGGSTVGLKELLDTRYAKEFLNPLSVLQFAPSAQRSGRVVLGEVFTGAGCYPCVTTDRAFDAILGRYPRSDVAVLMYHMHAPQPDPMTNPSGETRIKFYGVRGAPSVFIDGSADGKGGNAKAETKNAVYNRVRPWIEERLGIPAEATIQLHARLDGSKVKYHAVVTGLKTQSSHLSLQVALVEQRLSYSGSNGIRFHAMVVRDLAGPAHAGFPLDVAKSSTVDEVFDLSRIRASIKAYLDDYEVNGKHGKISFLQKMDRIDARNLAVVAFVQNMETKQVLQAMFVDLRSEGEPSARAAFEQGEAARNVGDFAKAAESFQEAIALDPGFVEAHQQFILVYGRAKNLSPDAASTELIELYSNWAGKEPKQAAFEWALGTLTPRDYASSEPHYLKAISIDPSFGAAYSPLSLIAEMRGENEKARDYLKKASDSNPDNPKYLLDYALGLKDSDPSEFQELTRRVVERFPNTDLAAQAMYWLAARSDSTLHQITWLERMRREYPPEAFPVTRSQMPSLFGIYVESDLKKAVFLADQLATSLTSGNDIKTWQDNAKYAADLLHVRELLGREEFRQAGELASTIKVPRFTSRTLLSLFQAEAAAGQGETVNAYEDLLRLVAVEPNDRLQTALEKYGTRLKKSLKEITADIWRIREEKAALFKDFSLKDYLEGKTVTLSGYRGYVILVNFWFPG